MKTILQLIETDIEEHLALEEKHLLARCKLIARIHEGKLWEIGGYKSFEEYMKLRWNVKKQEAYQLVKVGTNVEYSNEYFLKISHLKVLAHIDYQYRHATIEALSILPVDKITARAINRLSEILEELIVTGKVSLSNGEQFDPFAKDVILAAYMAEENEALLRRNEHIRGKQPPSASFSGYSLSEVLAHPQFRNLPPLGLCSAEIYDKGESVRVVLNILRQKENA